MTIEELEQLAEDQAAQRKAEQEAKAAEKKAKEAAAKSKTAADNRVKRMADLQAIIARQQAEALKIIRSREYKIDPGRKDYVRRLVEDNNNKQKEFANLEAQASGYRGMDVGRGSETVSPFVPTGPDSTAVTDQITPTATATGDAGAGSGTGTGTGAGTGAGTKPPKTPAAKTAKEKQELGKDAIIQAGINQAVVQYMKENYPEDWARIKELRDLAIQNGVLDAGEIRRIADAFKTTTYWKNAARENNRTTIGAYMIANGLDSISNAALIDKLTEDVFVTGVRTLQQAQADIRRDAVAKLGLTGPDADASKIKIAQAMIDGGQTFMSAAGDYIDFYTKTTDTPLNEFDPFEDSSFLSAFRESKSLTDFAQRIKATPSYLMSDKGRQEINSTKLQLQRLTRNLGLGYSPQQLEDQAVNVASGRETFEQIEYSLRSIAGEAFPAFKDRILAGESIASIASPYVSSMSRILEMPDSAIDISDPNSDIRKALIGDGKTPKPLWQFEQELFKDARWQYTSNARDTIDRVSMDILKRFGVMG